MKKITLGVIIGVFIAIGITTFGSSNNSNVASSDITNSSSDITNSIEANYTINDIIVNGVSSGAGSSAFISNGTTYVPLRTIAELLGIEVYWDSSSRNITINSSSSSEEELASPTDLEPITSSTSQTVTDSTSTSLPTSIYGNVNVTVDEAKEKALSLVGGGSIISFKEDLYYKNGPIRKYEIEILYNNMIYEIDIDAYTGNVKKFDVESIYD